MSSALLARRPVLAIAAGYSVALVPVAVLVWIQSGAGSAAVATLVDALILIGPILLVRGGAALAAKALPGRAWWVHRAIGGLAATVLLAAGAGVLTPVGLGIGTPTLLLVGLANLVLVAMGMGIEAVARRRAGVA